MSMKVAIIGAGAVGSACATALVLRGCAREIVVIDRTPARAIGLATDVRYGATLSPAVNVRSGDYSDLKGVDLVVITAGVNEKTGAPPTAATQPAGCDCSTPTSACTRTLFPGLSLLNLKLWRSSLLIRRIRWPTLRASWDMIRFLAREPILTASGFGFTWLAGLGSARARSARTYWVSTEPRRCLCGPRRA